MRNNNLAVITNHFVRAWLTEPGGLGWEIMLFYMFNI